MFKLLNKKTDNKSSVNNELFLLDDNSRFDIKEAYNELRTNIIFSIPKKDCKVICITSSMASEGKSTVSVNNAVTFAKSGKKILLIDCDLRKPNVANILKMKNKKGLSEVLVETESAQNVINKNVFENLDVMFAGSIPPNPVELISSDNMEKLINNLKKDYDYIFIDTPPINVVTDAAIVSRLTDGVIMVARQNVAEKKLFTEAINKLEFAKAKIIGVVLNGVDNFKEEYYKYSYK